MPNQTDVVNQMIQALAASEPDLDTSIGTPVRKVLDVVAEQISEAYVDQFFQGFQYDIDTLSGSALDDFVSQFGFVRFAARRATGVVTFARQNPSTFDILIPTGTIITTATAPPVVFYTLVPALLPLGGVSLDVPSVAALGGSGGNVTANSVTTFGVPINGLSTLANTAAFSGGTDLESDSALIARFKATALRGFTGTEQMFLGTVLEDPNAVIANVIGARKTHTEQVQLVSGTATSVIASAKYVYPYNYAFGPDLEAGDLLNPGIHYTLNTTNPVLVAPTGLALVNTASGGTLPGSTTYAYRVAAGNAAGVSVPCTEVTLALGGTSNNRIALTWTAVAGATNIMVYGRTSGAEQLIAVLVGTATTYTDLGSITPSGPMPTVNATGVDPIVTSIDAINASDGIYELQFDYLPVASRNDPANNITNRVDIYVQGNDITQASEVLAFTNANPFTINPVDPLFFTRFQRSDLTQPMPGNYFLKLTFTPVVTLPSTLTFGGITYSLGSDYYLVNDITPLGGSAHSNSGIEWVSVANGAPHAIPANGTQIPFSPPNQAYSYNALPRENEVAIQAWRLACTDVWVHQARTITLNVSLVVILSSGATTTSVLSPVTTALQSVFSNVGFDQILQVSDVLRAVGGVSGVDAVRFATGPGVTNNDSPSAYAMQQTNPSGGIIATYAVAGRAIDVVFTDDSVPVLNLVNITVRAQNSYNTGA